MANPFLAPLLIAQAGLTIAGGINKYNAEKKRAQLERTREIERQTLVLKQYVEEVKARQAESRLQQSQLRNALLESEEIAESDKGDIALAAEKAKSAALASQASSGMEAGTGTFAGVLNEIGFTEQAEIADVEVSLANRRAQTGSEILATEMAARVPEPHLSKVAPLDTRNLAIGTGLQIASGLTNIAMEHAPLGTFGKKIQNLFG